MAARRWFRLVASILWLVAAACSRSGNAPSTSPSAVPSTAASPIASAAVSPSATVPVDRVTFTAYNVRLDPTAEEGGDHLGAQVGSSGPVSVVLHGTDGSVRLCASGSLDEPGDQPCSQPADGAATSVDGSGFVLDASSQPVTLQAVTVSYIATTHAVKMRLPNLIPKPGASVCKDNGCNPFFEFGPRLAGTLRAVGTWDGIATAKLVIENGAVAAHASTATGQPYDELDSDTASSDQGPGHVAVAATVDTSEVAVAMSNEGARLVRTPSLDITWP